MASYQKYNTKQGERWMVQLTIGTDPKTGRPKKTTRRGFLRKKDAEAEAVNIMRKLKKKEYINKAITFEEVYQEWMKQNTKKLKPSTLQNKRSKFQKHILPAFAKLIIKNVTVDYCQDFIDKLSKEMVSFKDYGIQTRFVFDFAIKKQYLVDNPMNYVIYPKRDEDFLATQDRKIHFWEKNIIHKFLDKCEMESTFRDYAMFRTFLFTGLRKGELLALQETDINDDQTITINKTLFWRNDQHILLKPKTKNAHRTIFIDDETYSVLTRLIEMNTKIREEFYKTHNKEVEKFLFPRNNLRPMRLAYPNERMNILCDTFNITNIKVHGLRHTHASMLFASGVRMKDVQMRLGHARIQTTMDIYTHTVRESDENTSEKFIQYMNEETEEPDEPDP